MTGAVSDIGFPVLEALEAIFLRGTEGLDKLSLRTVNKDGLVSALNSLFQVCESAYEDRPGKFFAICGKIPANGLLATVRLKRSISPRISPS